MKETEQHKTEIFDSKAEYSVSEAERRRRISREVVIEQPQATDEPHREETDSEHTPKSKSIWQHITTGTFLTSGAQQYYGYLIAIAAMCFLSIFLTFMSWNADREYRRLEQYAMVLNERAVLKAEERYSLSSKSAVTERLKSYGIVLVDLSNESRLIEK